MLKGDNRLEEYGENYRMRISVIPFVPHALFKSAAAMACFSLDWAFSRLVGTGVGYLNTGRNITAGKRRTIENALGF